MINYAFLKDWNLHCVGAQETCSLLGLVQYGMKIGESSGPEADLDLPAIFDLRDIELATDTSQDIKRAIRLRKTLKANTGNNPCAYVVGSMGSFGIMRMYGIYADLEGLRNEKLTLITMDMTEAIDWIIGHLGVSEPEAQLVRKALAEQGLVEYSTS